MTRYVSLDKSTVNLTGSDETLFFVRDMTALVNMQQLSHMRQLLSTFAQKCLQQIQESQRLNMLSMQKGQDSSKADVVSDMKKTLMRIVDYQQVYSICSSSSINVPTEQNISASQILEQVQGAAETEFQRRNLSLSISGDDSSSDLMVRANSLALR